MVLILKIRFIYMSEEIYYTDNRHDTQVYRFINCKLAVESKLVKIGPARIFKCTSVARDVYTFLCKANEEHIKLFFQYLYICKERRSIDRQINKRQAGAAKLLTFNCSVLLQVQLFTMGQVKMQFFLSFSSALKSKNATFIILIFINIKKQNLKVFLFIQIVIS